jgi:hypothetical protein
MKLSLAKALKLKNKLVKEVNKHLKIVQKYNSYESTKKPNFDAKAAYIAYTNTIAKLIDLKTAIAIANGPIFHKIYEMAELKGMITNIQQIDTTAGKQDKSMGYNQPNKEIEIVADFRDKDVAGIVSNNEKTIEELQDQIDSFNHGTEIEI